MQGQNAPFAAGAIDVVVAPQRPNTSAEELAALGTESEGVTDGHPGDSTDEEVDGVLHADSPDQSYVMTCSRWVEVNRGSLLTWRAERGRSRPREA